MLDAQATDGYNLNGPQKKLNNRQPHWETPMTPTQRYLFDLQGYLHIPDVLTPEQLASGRAAIDRYIATPDEQLPEGFARSADGKNYENGFAFDKALESLVMHPALWPIIREFTHDKPAFSRGTLLVDTHEHPPLNLHCAREEDKGQCSPTEKCTDHTHQLRIAET